MRTSLFHYHLPPQRIAHRPAVPRDRSRLFVLDRKKKRSRHLYFHQIPELLREGDVLVVNDTKVIPARLHGAKKSGGSVEMLLLEEAEKGRRRVAWKALLKGTRIKKGTAGVLARSSIRFLVEKRSGSMAQVRFLCSHSSLQRYMRKEGEAPLPPYIRAHASGRIARAYQTVYAKQEGSVAAPTAGLHFTPRVLRRLKARGVQIAAVTLHVGYGTFQPVRSQHVEHHKIHEEWARIPEESAAAINLAKREGRRVIAAGTTVVRTLEAYARPGRPARVQAGAGLVDIFIYPGFSFRIVDGMITNFHLPQSSLLMLVSAFAGRKRILGAYKKAIRRGYRFYSFGDAMLIF